MKSLIVKLVDVRAEFKSVNGQLVGPYLRMNIDACFVAHVQEEKPRMAAPWGVRIFSHLFQAAIRIGYARALSSPRGCLCCCGSATIIPTLFLLKLPRLPMPTQMSLSRKWANRKRFFNWPIRFLKLRISCTFVGETPFHYYRATWSKWQTVADAKCQKLLEHPRVQEFPHSPHT